MGSKVLNVYVESNKPFKQLKDDCARMYKTLGGQIFETPTGFYILNGAYGTSFSFVANLFANCSIRQIKENSYDIQINLDWKWGTFMWFALVFGIIAGGFPLLLLIFYLFYDPAPAYNRVLYQIVNYEKM